MAHVRKFIIRGDFVFAEAKGSVSNPPCPRRLKLVV